MPVLVGRAPVDIVQTQFCAAIEQIALGALAFAGTDTESPRERALRVAGKWLGDLPALDTLPPELAESVDATISCLAILRDPACSSREVGVFICSVLSTAILATQYASVGLLAEQQRLADGMSDEAVH